MKRILDIVLSADDSGEWGRALRCSATGYEGDQMKRLALLQMKAAEQIYLER